jgi:hypothetical protein
MSGMTDSKALARPPQVTMAGWVTIVGSVFVVLAMYDAVANLRTIETRERVSDLLSEPPLDGSGLDVDQWLSIMNGVFLVGAACAATTGILGWYVMQRSHPARLALTVVTVPLFVTGLFSGAFTTSLVAVSAMLLWTRPSRDWFNGKAPAPVPAPRSSLPPTPSDQSSAPPSAPLYGPPPAWPSQPGPPPPGQSPPGQPPVWQQPYARFPPPAAPARPRALLQACIVTWVVAGIVLATTALAFIVFAADPGIVDMMRERDPSAVEDLNMSDAELRTTALIGIGVIAAWAASAVVLAFLAYRRQNWARICLIISAVTSSLLALTTASLVVPLLPVAAAGFTAYALLRPEVRTWFTRR